MNLSLPDLSNKKNDRKKQDEIINSLEEKVNEDTDQVVMNKIKNEMDLEISPGDIDRTHRIGVLSKDKNRPIIIKFVRYMDKRCVFTNKKRLKGKNMSITESLTKTRMIALKKARNKFGYSNVLTADGKIMYKEEGDTKTKFILIDIVASRSCVTEKTGFVFDFDGIILFSFVWGIFYEAFQNSNLLWFLILFRGILPLIKMILIKIWFIHFISLNITILLCLQFSNLDCNKKLTSIS